MPLTAPTVVGSHASQTIRTSAADAFAELGEQPRPAGAALADQRNAHRPALVADGGEPSRQLGELTFPTDEGLSGGRRWDLRGRHRRVASEARRKAATRSRIERSDGVPFPSSRRFDHGRALR
jgi:hypothetical protein